MAFRSRRGLAIEAEEDQQENNQDLRKIRMVLFSFSAPSTALIIGCVCLFSFLPDSRTEYKIKSC